MLSPAPLLLSLVALVGCAVSRPADPIPPHDSFEIVSEAVGETRVVNVWRPPSVVEGEVLPVLYMPDGGVREDFPHLANTLAELVARGEIAPLLLVGIENTERRRDLTGPSEVAADAEIAPITDGASRFRAFVRDELFPEIEARYAVDGRRGIVGESAAGLFVVETLFLAPEMFEVYLAMDPAIYWNDDALVRKAPERLPHLPEGIRFWFTASGVADIKVPTDRLGEILAESAPSGLTWTYVPRPDEHHHTIFRATKEEAFRWGLWGGSAAGR